MGGHCSAALVRPGGGLEDGCRPFDVACCDEEADCGLCGEEPGGGPAAAQHPLLQADGATPRTPRARPVDRTATGATPPRSPTPPRITPPGLPDEEATRSSSSISGKDLANALESSLLQDLFAAARSNNCGALSTLVQRVNTSAIALICGTQGGGGNSIAPEGAVERAAEMMAGFLSKARDPTSPQPRRETLLGAAAGARHAEALHFLLNARADPMEGDEKGSGALHCAAESGSLLAVLLVLDRLQAGQRSIGVAELTNVDGETPEMFAALAGASDVCRAFEVFSDMQNDAELRQLGSSFSASDVAGGGKGIGTGDLFAFMDLAAEPRSPAGATASALLQRSTLGGPLARSLARRIPEPGPSCSRGILAGHDLEPGRPRLGPCGAGIRDHSRPPKCLAQDTLAGAEYP